MSAAAQFLWWWRQIPGALCALFVEGQMLGPSASEMGGSSTSGSSAVKANTALRRAAAMR